MWVRRHFQKKSDGGQLFFAYFSKTGRVLLSNSVSVTNGMLNIGQFGKDAEYEFD